MASRAVLIDDDSYEISYEKFLSNSGGGGCETILILHGWGANKELMSGVFASKFSDFNQIYIDLPGFGKSSQPARPLNSYDYAKIVREFLADLGVKPRFILGHSFGGKVATLLAPDILILCSSAGILEPKSLKIRAKIGVFKGLKYVGLGKLCMLLLKTLSRRILAMYLVVMKLNLRRIKDGKCLFFGVKKIELLV